MLKKLFFALVIALAALAVSGAVFKPETKKVEVNYVVARGQTLWEITGELQEQYGDKRDIREIMYHARKTNGIINAHIQPGQVIIFTLEVPK